MTTADVLAPPLPLDESLAAPPPPPSREEEPESDDYWANVPCTD